MLLFTDVDGSLSIPVFTSMPGCKVIGVLKEQQAASQRENLTIQILGNLQQTYLKDIEVFASALGDEVNKPLCSNLTKC